MKTRLSELLIKNGIERKVIADDLNIERRTMNNYVTETTLMNSDTIVKVAAYLGVTTDYLLCVDKPKDDFVDVKIDEICDKLKEIIYHIKENN